MAALQRMLFEVEREFVRCATTLIYRVGEPELKYLLCQHVWESAGHARFLRERGREMSGFGKGDSVRPEFRKIFEEAILPEDAYVALAVFYRVIKPAILAAYRHYLEATHQLADWPSRKLVEEFILDEEKHAREIAPYLESLEPGTHEAHLKKALADLGGWLGQEAKEILPEDYVWNQDTTSYRHPDTCNRGKFPTCSSVFS
ncbi:MAG: ferritin-like domain-containing protein, partial [Verrucomicrobiae bacterium]|nr:ferritin-like domain-containing protein [Verrucomicrobiae bacterium]